VAEDETAGDARSRVPAVTRAIDVLDDVARNGSGSLAELARRLGLPKSTLLGICQSLVEERLLAKDSTGRYRLGLAVAELAAARRLEPPRLGTIGVTVQNLSNPFFIVELQGICAAAADLGSKVLVRDAQQDIDIQCDHLDEFVDLRVDAIIVDAVNSTDIGRALKRARAEAIPVIAVNVGATGADATVTTDNVQAGQAIGRFLARRLNGRGRIAIVDGLPVTAVSDRITGFISALRDFPRIVISHRTAGDHSRAGGIRAVQEIFADDPRPEAIFAINDPTAEGVVAALTQRHLSVPVASVDGSASAVRAITADGPLIASAAQSPAELGRLAVSLAADLHAGRTIHPRIRLLPTTLITADNLQTYQAWG